MTAYDPDIIDPFVERDINYVDYENYDFDNPEKERLKSLDRIENIVCVNVPKFIIE